MINRVFIMPALILFIMSICSSAQEFTWGSVTIGGGGFVSGIITSKTEKNVIYARTDVGGAYRWQESSRSWIALTDWLGPNDMGLFGIDAIALDPSTPGRLYMLAGTDYWNQGKTMIMRSDNYGDSFDTINVTALFKTHGNGYGRQNGERLAVDPNNPQILYCGTRANGLWKSIDRGSNWTKVAGITAPANEQGVCLVLFDKNRVSAGTTQRIYIGMSVGGSNNLFVTDNAGDTWVPIALPALTKQVMPQRAVLTPGGKYLYVTTGNGAGPGFGNGTTISRGALLRYDTELKNWKDLSPEDWISDPPNPDMPGQTIWDAHFGGFGGISMDATDSTHIVVSSINAWKPQRWDNATRVGWGDKIFATTDGGSSWVDVFGNQTDSTIKLLDETAPIAVLGKNGYNWIEGESIHWAGSIEMDPFNPKRVFITSGNGIYMADNFSPGKRFTWNFTVRGLEETVPEDLVSIPGGPLITVIGDYDGFVHTNVTKPTIGNRHYPTLGSTTGIDYAKNNPAIIVRVGGNEKVDTAQDYLFPLYYSTDTAKTWKKFATHPGVAQNYKGKIAISSDGKVVLWNPQEKNVLLRTDNWGATWTTCAGVSGVKCFPTADPVNPDVFYAFSSEVYRSTDRGVSFSKVSNGSFSFTTDMQVTPGKEGHIWVVGFAWDGLNGGFLARSTDGGTTFIKIDPAVDPAYTQKVQHAEAIGFGKAAPGASYPAMYIYGTIGGVLGVYQSIDEAKSWTKIDDPQHRFGALANGNFVLGDANTFGVVYRSTAGRGIACRMPADWTTPTIRRITGNTTTLQQQVHLSQSFLQLPAGSADAAFQLSIYDLLGRVVVCKTVTGPATIALRQLVKAHGSYIITVRSETTLLLARTCTFSADR